MFMKKILFSLFALLSSGAALAQLYVNQDGITNTNRINVETSGSSDDVGIYVYLNKQSLAYKGICSEVNAYYGGANANYRYGIGVQGIAKRALDGNYAIYGYVPTYTYPIYNYGAAIYGTNNANRIILDNLYAGYFDGLVGVNGNMSVSGTIMGQYLVQTSTRSVMQDAIVSTEPTSLISQLSSLQLGTFYKDNTENVVRAKDGDESNVIDEKLADKEKKITSEDRLHYGLIADDLKEVFPDLVYEEDDKQYINYVEMVPILVQAINELSAKVAELEGGNDSARKVAAKATGIDSADESVQVLSLSQNKPNPFGTSTEIEVNVPESVQSAFVYVYDLQGKKVLQVDITARGKQTIHLDAADLSDGMYLYSLIADGKVVETRRMIVEK